MENDGLALLHLRAEGFFLQPVGVPALLDLGEFVGLGEIVFLGALQVSLFHRIFVMPPMRAVG